jgi:hypothetical protein
MRAVFHGRFVPLGFAVDLQKINFRVAAINTFYINQLQTMIMRHGPTQPGEGTAMEQLDPFRRNAC